MIFSDVHVSSQRKLIKKKSFQLWTEEQSRSLTYVKNKKRNLTRVTMYADKITKAFHEFKRKKFIVDKTAHQYNFVIGI